MKNLKFSPCFLSVTLFFIFWELLGRYISKPFILPCPTSILKKIWVLKNSLFLTHLPSTLKIAFISIVISMVLGITLAILMDLSETIEKALYPIIITTQTIPITALAPVFILWFGYSIWSKVIVSVLITFFPVSITIYNSFKKIPKDQINFLKSLEASNLDIFLKLKIPASIFSFFSALKMSVPLTLIGASIGEWLGATSGLGYFSKRMMSQLDGAGVFAPIVIISSLAILLVQIISLIEYKTLHWRNK